MRRGSNSGRLAFASGVAESIATWMRASARRWGRIVSLEGGARATGMAMEGVERECCACCLEHVHGRWWSFDSSEGRY